MEKREITIPLNTTSLLVALLVIAAFLLGSLWTRLQTLEKKVAAAPANGAVAGAQVPPAEAPPAAGEVAPLAEKDHVNGKRDARLLLIEYSDFECPFCQRFHPTAQQALDEYGDEVAWVYRHFPLDQLHQQARPEALASECVYEQTGDEGFWKFTDHVYKITPTNDGLDLTQLPTYAQEAGVTDIAKFQACLDSKQYDSRIEEDLASGAKAGVTGTPGSVLLDTKSGKSQLISGAVPYPQLKSAIDQMLAN